MGSPLCPPSPTFPLSICLHRVLPVTAGRVVSPATNPGQVPRLLLSQEHLDWPLVSTFPWIVVFLSK